MGGSSRRPRRGRGACWRACFPRCQHSGWQCHGRSRRRPLSKVGEQSSGVRRVSKKSAPTGVTPRSSRRCKGTCVVLALALASILQPASSCLLAVCECRTRPAAPASVRVHGKAATPPPRARTHAGGPNFFPRSSRPRASPTGRRLPPPSLLAGCVAPRSALALGQRTEGSRSPDRLDSVSRRPSPPRWHARVVADLGLPNEPAGPAQRRFITHPPTRTPRRPLVAAPALLPRC